MANLKEIRLHIASVKSMQQITSAMKMVSAAKLRKAQDAIIHFRPFAAKLYEILASISSNIDGSVINKYSDHKEVKKILIIAITSNRGLCGGFNSNVTRKVLELLNEKFSDYYQDDAVDIMVIGKKAVDTFKAKNIRIAKSYTDIYDNLTFANVSEISQSVMDAYTSGTYDKVMLIYNRFKNAVVQELMVEQFLPVLITDIKQPSDNEKLPNSNYIFEPSMQAVVDNVIPRSLKVHFYRMLLDSVAAEHGARMTAMHKASDNASELARDLKLEYNKARQASITNEILEIVSGANALKN
jgi:F-type H+-transporting ATPase subunit gamma